MTDRTDWVAAWIDPSTPLARDRAVHEALRKMHRSLAPDLQDRVVVESYYAPEGNGWRLVMHRLPFEAPHSTPEEDEARRRAVIEEALADPRGLALARAIIERKDLHEALVDYKPGGTSADDEPDQILTQEKIDAYNAAAAAVPVEERPINPHLDPAYREALDRIGRPRVVGPEDFPTEAELRADLSRPKTGVAE